MPGILLIRPCMYITNTKIKTTMKLKFRLQVAGKIACIVICAGLLITQPVSASSNHYNVFATYKNKTATVPLLKQKNISIFLHNNNSVKIYLDASQKKVHVIAKENNGRQIDFFLFDLEGTLVHNHKLKVKGHHRVTNLIKGVYVYRVFCGDEETASGQLEIQ